MPVQDQSPSSHSNQYNANSACGHCDGILRHEPWCITQNLSVQYAYQVISDAGNLSPGDHLILHALGTAWTATELPDVRGARRQSGFAITKSNQSIQ